ncbi:MAG: hypothetical protein GY725_08135 [bacterium]|nr:hypothetical protein [bacterium]
MELWSKGLGRMVLEVRLSDRNEMRSETEGVVVHGTMGPPVYWGYAVTLGGGDVVDFIALLEQPAAVSFLVKSRQRWNILGSALLSMLVFAGAFARRLLVSPRARTTTASSHAEGETVRQGENTDA